MSKLFSVFVLLSVFISTAFAFDVATLNDQTFLHENTTAPDATLMPYKTIEQAIEQFLIRKGLVQKTPRGRIAMPKAYEWIQQTE